MPQLDPSLAHALTSGASVLTPNQRSARAIARAWDAQQQASGLRLWTPASVYPLSQWLVTRWNEQLQAGVDDRMLLNAAQQHALWCEILLSDRESALRSPHDLADLAARAWSLLCLYQGRGRLREFPLSTDSRAFERWSRAFERRLTRDRLITHAQLPAELSAPAPVHLVLVDFDTHPPALQHLFRRLEDAGTIIEALQTQMIPATASLFVATDDAAEREALTEWLRGHLKSNPAARLAVVVPNLQDRRALLQRTLSAALEPADSLLSNAKGSPPFEFSLGTSLGALPIATAALDLLHWTLSPLPLERIGGLLLSPWFTGSMPAAAAFDAFELRQASLLQPELSLDNTIGLVERSRSRAALSDLLHRLRSLRKAAREAVPQIEVVELTHTEWAETFRTLLQASGWTAHATSYSLAFQQHRRFESALDEFSTLDFDVRTLTVSDALQALSRILNGTIFAPESKDAAVQILGPLEVGGVCFDALWFFNADDLAWPMHAAQSPLLPWQLRQALGLPGVDRTRDDSNATQLTQRIARSAAEVVFSFAKRSDEGERRPSPLLSALALTSLTLPAPMSVASAALEQIFDATSLLPLPDRTVAGGASVLQLQAACGFRAFAERRLFATSLDRLEPGLDALERGNLVHNVMQAFWTGLKSQAALLALPEAERLNLLDQAIADAIHRAYPHPGGAWEEAYLRVQARRLHDVLAPWIADEAKRPSFTVQPPEQKKSFQLGPLHLSLRIDRIDETPSGGIIILDYKTGPAAPSQWQTERPDAPQLPLYAVLSTAEGARVEALAFALLRAGKDLGLKGYTEDATLFKPGAMSAPSLAEQIDQWSDVLTRLAHAFADGDTRVLPKRYPATCKHCQQRILCRLDPATLEDAADEESEGDTANG